MDHQQQRLLFWRNVLFFVGSLLLVGFGQPAFSSFCSVAAAIGGYAFFWRLLCDIPSGKQRFWLATAWFFGVQIIQLSWMVSHPFIYIFAVYFGLAFFVGMQFGVVALFIQPSQLKSWPRLLAIAGLWCLMEWSRLFILSGFSWNPVGLALTGSLYGLQTASLGGIYALSFWVILVNLLALRTWMLGFRYGWAWVSAAALPFLYGMVHLHLHEEAFANQQKDPTKKLSAILVQTAFPVEEVMNFKDQKSMIAYVLDEWKQILKITKQHLNAPTDLVVLPEFTVPYGTYSCIFPYPVVVAAFKEIYGPESIKKLPRPEAPWAMPIATTQGDVWMVNNAFWSQALANIFNAEVVIGLEDIEEKSPEEKEYYSAALHFQPGIVEGADFTVNRYEKRVLAPMGEYIPFSFLKKLAESYGVYGSFTPGTEAKVFGSKVPLGFSICYEETFGDLMRESRVKGAEVIVNLTSDVWYPNSRLTQQHYDHSRLRTVENGIPLVRACNTGITGVTDSFGRVVATLGDNPAQAEWVSDSIKVEVPTYHYKTLYSRFGDTLIIGLSVFLVLFFLRLPAE